MTAAVSVANEIENNAMLHFVSGQTARPLSDEDVEKLYKKAPL